MEPPNRTDPSILKQAVARISDVPHELNSTQDEVLTRTQGIIEVPPSTSCMDPTQGLMHLHCAIAQNNQAAAENIDNRVWLALLHANDPPVFERQGPNKTDVEEAWTAEKLTACPAATIEGTTALLNEARAFLQGENRSREKTYRCGHCKKRGHNRCVARHEHFFSPIVLDGVVNFSHLTLKTISEQRVQN